jgi:hypothetical protein
MIKIPRNPRKYELIKIVDSYSRECNIDIEADDKSGNISRQILKQITENKNNKSLIHGFRIQAMFAYVAAALGRCKLIKEEDAGEAYTSDAKLVVPDYAIIRNDGLRFYVEVKNSHKQPVGSYFSIPKSKLDGMNQYASLNGGELFIAIFWSKPQLWTMIRVNDLELNGTRLRINLLKAIKVNNMNLIGDSHIGTTPKLSIKFVTDPANDRSIQSDGNCKPRIKSVEAYCGDYEITDSLGKRLIWFIIHHGEWPTSEIEPCVSDGNLISFGFRVEPKERENPNEGFEIAGILSQMISRQYNATTAPGGIVKSLVPDLEPLKFGVLIPDNYKNIHFPLWIFSQQSQ